MAEIGYVHVNDMLVVVLGAPDALQELSARKDPPGCLARVASSDNSRGVSATGCPSSVTSWRAASIVSRPMRSGGGDSAAPKLPARGRRSIALTRATNSRGLNGLVR